MKAHDSKETQGRALVSGFRLECIQVSEGKSLLMTNQCTQTRIS